MIPALYVWQERQDTPDGPQTIEKTTPVRILDFQTIQAAPAPDVPYYAEPTFAQVVAIIARDDDGMVFTVSLHDLRMKPERPLSLG